MNPVQKPMRTGQYGGGEEQEMLTYGPESYVPGDRCPLFHGMMKKFFERGESFQILGTMSWARVGPVPVIATRREPFPGEEKTELLNITF